MVETATIGTITLSEVAKLPRTERPDCSLVPDSSQATSCGCWSVVLEKQAKE